MGGAVRLKDSQKEQDRRSARQAQKAKRDALDAEVVGLEGKTFDSLTGPEKDTLLKALAIQAGLIEG